jgi:hypothetical protein
MGGLQSATAADSGQIRTVPDSLFLPKTLFVPSNVGYETGTHVRNRSYLQDEIIRGASSEAVSYSSPFIAVNIKIGSQIRARPGHSCSYLTNPNPLQSLSEHGIPGRFGGSDCCVGLNGHQRTCRLLHQNFQRNLENSSRRFPLSWRMTNMGQLIRAVLTVCISRP